MKKTSKTTRTTQELADASSLVVACYAEAENLTIYSLDARASDLAPLLVQAVLAARLREALHVIASNQGAR